MKYFFDTEFHEYKVGSVDKSGSTRLIDTIDLISIGMVAEDGREYYAICNEFDIVAAWNNKWLKDNVLIHIHNDLIKRHNAYGPNILRGDLIDLKKDTFSFMKFKKLVKLYGKSKEEIAEEIYTFVMDGVPNNDGNYSNITKPEFYAYYADYDWVVFCWLYGRMINLPSSYPYYCRDLIQMLNDEKVRLGITENIKKLDGYPTNSNKHNALADARWNIELYKFIMGLEARYTVEGAINKANVTGANNIVIQHNIRSNGDVIGRDIVK